MKKYIVAIIVVILSILNATSQQSDIFKNIALTGLQVEDIDQTELIKIVDTLRQKGWDIAVFGYYDITEYSNSHTQDQDYLDFIERIDSVIAINVFRGPNSISFEIKIKCSSYDENSLKFHEDYLDNALSY